MSTTVEKNSTLDVPERGSYITGVNWVIYSGAYIQGVLMYRGHINEIFRYFHLESKLFFLRQFNKNRHGGMFKVKILDSLSRLTGCNWSITENKIHGITVFYVKHHVMVS